MMKDLLSCNLEFQATFKPAVVPFQQFLWPEPFTEERVSIPEDRLALISSRAKIEGMHCLLTTGRMPSCSVLLIFYVSRWLMRGFRGMSPC
jgi:hypothetical protein